MILLALLCSLAGSSTVGASNVTVNTSLGPVVGTAAGSEGTGSCATFYGVRYAAPPTGANRFRPPQPATPWTEPRPAMHVGKSCLQTFGDSLFNLPTFVEVLLEDLHLGMEPMSEDCLFLNVFTPRVPTSGDGAGRPRSEAAPGNESGLLPVMVWFHGGSNMGGSGDLQSDVPFYDGRALCATEGAPEAVIVTVNYRLGVFGFLAHDALLQDEGTAGNMGFQDQRAALEWVAANAEKFGGDPARVTIFGESAGAGDTAVHLSTRRSAPLFSAGIMQSGGLWVMSYEESREQSRGVVELVGCGGNSSSRTPLECLRAVPSERMLLAQKKAGWGDVNPCADGYEYPRNITQRQRFRSGDFTPKPMMVGTNQNESALFDCGTSTAKAVVNETTFRAEASRETGLQQDSPEMDKLVTLYDAVNYGADWQRAFIDMNTDLHFYCGSREVLDAVAAKDIPVWQCVWFEVLFGRNHSTYHHVSWPHSLELKSMQCFSVGTDCSTRHCCWTLCLAGARPT